MKKISIIYWSATGNTESMANYIKEGAMIDGNEVHLISVEKAKNEDILNSDAIALGCPSMGCEELEEGDMEPFVESLKEIDLSNKPMALFGSYDWGDGEWMRNWYDRMKNYGANVIDEGLIINLDPDEKGKQQCIKLGEKLAKCE